MTIDKIAALKSTSLFGSLDEAALRLLADRAIERHFSVREVVSRAFTRLQHDGLINVEGRSLLIPNEESLESFAGQQ